METQGNEETVTSETRVASILKGLASSRSLLTVMLADSPKTMSTTLLDLTDDGIVLDELVQNRGENRFQAGSRFSAYCKNKGIPIVFRSEVQEVSTGADGEYYICSIPDSVKYNQKRTNFRLPTRGRFPEIQLTIGDTVIECSARDISEGGSKIIALPDLDLQSGDEIKSCTIKLADQVLNTKLRICHVHENNRQGVQELGVEFHAMSPKDKKVLRDWIFTVERQRLRRL